jgi:hypothetical protein
LEPFSGEKVSKIDVADFNHPAYFQPVETNPAQHQRFRGLGTPARNSGVAERKLPISNASAMS